MHSVQQRLLAAVAVFAIALALFNQEVAAGLVAAGALVAWAMVTVAAERRTNPD